MKDRGSNDADDRQPTNVVTLDPRAGRPEPPPELTADEAAEWRRLVGCMPHNWVTPENVDTLDDYCRFFDLMNVLSRELRTMLERGLNTREDTAACIRLQTAGDAAAFAMLECATKLKLTPESQGADWVVIPDA